MKSQNLTLKRGDTGRWMLLCVNNDGLPLNLVGAVIRLYAKANRSQADALATLKLDSAGLGGIVITNAGAGEALVTVTPAMTASLTQNTHLFYDVQVTESDGTVTTLIEGVMQITLDVTQVG